MQILPKFVRFISIQSSFNWGCRYRAAECKDICYHLTWERIDASNWLPRVKDFMVDGDGNRLWSCCNSCLLSGDKERIGFPFLYLSDSTAAGRPRTLRLTGTVFVFDNTSAGFRLSLSVLPSFKQISVSANTNGLLGKIDWWGCINSPYFQPHHCLFLALEGRRVVCLIRGSLSFDEWFSALRYFEHFYSTWLLLR